MTYDKLYLNMVKKFTVEKNNVDYKLGDYMLMKAKGKKNTERVNTADVRNSTLPIKVEHKGETAAISTILSYVNEKITVKEAPIKDKTIRSFPLRTTFTAFCSAVVVCGLVVCCGLFGIMGGKGNGLDSTVENNKNTEITETIDYSSENQEFDK
jgi:hypothetical protein